VDAYPLVGRDQMYEAEVHNFGRQPHARQLVELFVDGRRAAEQFVDLGPGGSAVAAFPYRFDAPGDHSVEVRLAGDLLDIVYLRFRAAPVEERIRVLCVDGRPRGGGFKGAADYLAVALAPDADNEHRALVEANVISEGALVNTDLGGYDC